MNSLRLLINLTQTQTWFQIFFFKLLICINCSAVLYFFNLYLSTDTFPNFWKSSFITSILKNSGVTSTTNYCSVSLHSIIPTIFESIILKKITLLLSPSVCVDPHGFISGYKSINFPKNSYIWCFCIWLPSWCYLHRLTKAFDKVNHTTHVFEIHNIGIITYYRLGFHPTISNGE